MSDKSFVCGPNNPHPLSQMRTELVWDGKYDEYGRRREVNIAELAMPMQRIETVDEPRSRAEAEGQLPLWEKQTSKAREKEAEYDAWRSRKRLIESQRNLHQEKTPTALLTSGRWISTGSRGNLFTTTGRTTARAKTAASAP